MTVSCVYSKHIQWAAISQRYVHGRSEGGTRAVKRAGHCICGPRWYMAHTHAGRDAACAVVTNLPPRVLCSGISGKARGLGERSPTCMALLLLLPACFAAPSLPLIRQCSSCCCCRICGCCLLKVLLQLRPLLLV